MPYIEGVRSGDRRMLAKAITLIESLLPLHQDLAQSVIEELLPFTGDSIRLGITGVPGVGKSTFIESLGLYLVNQGKRVAVLAVDPSSARSGGSIMGDKTRMEKLAVHENAFIRPSPAGRTLGGVSRKTRESMLVCEAGGFDVIIVETVGVGQSEYAVASMVDFFLVLMLAGAGDELQGIKRGLLEMADALAINKAEGENVDAAERARKAYENAIHLMAPVHPEWIPPILTCSALEHTGIDDIWKTVLRHRELLISRNELKLKRQEQAIAWMNQLLEESLKNWFYSKPEMRQILSDESKRVGKGEIHPTAVVRKMIDLLPQSDPKNLQPD
jgi:LAO/AO transport system kinase